jgi:hypothetical protein
MRAACMEIQKANIDVDDDQEAAHKHCDGESFGPEKARIQQLKKNAIGAVLAVSLDVAKARKNVGEALHTIYDFYAHSNWVELGQHGPERRPDPQRSPWSRTLPHPISAPATRARTLPSQRRGMATGPVPCIGTTCTENTNGFLKLTSGYYHYEDVAIPGDFKCRHGGFSDDGSWAGINKDSLNCWWSPHFHLHVMAPDLC